MGNFSSRIADLWVTNNCCVVLYYCCNCRNVVIIPCYQRSPEHEYQYQCECYQYQSIWHLEDPVARVPGAEMTESSLGYQELK